MENMKDASELYATPTENLDTEMLAQCRIFNYAEQKHNY